MISIKHIDNRPGWSEAREGRAAEKSPRWQHIRHPTLFLPTDPKLSQEVAP
ncbi:MAG: hypothetical protein KHX24_02195 [Clostridiales bacterium]|nr:hypothetical protein [Clostridiales bacterium]